MSSWLEALERRGREAMGAPVPAARTVKPHEPEPEIKTVWITTRPRRDGDMGEAACGHYSVADGTVTMSDGDGKATGKSRRLLPGDDAHQIAGRMTREAWLASAGASDFNRRLDYQRGSVA